MGDGHRSRFLGTGDWGFSGRRVARAMPAEDTAVTAVGQRPFPGDAIDIVLPDPCDPSVLERAVHLDTDAADIAAGILAAWHAKATEPLILGAGELVTVNDIIAASRSVTGKELPVTYVPAKPGEMPAVIVDVSLARSIGHVPEQDLKSGLATVWPEFAEAAQ